ncbi:WD40-repeat-containing domain protein [Chaetomidium leptoderma]|uniref:WD40-repeat-containing domain protein n=1 Tax=Chaetomidium leptoderma TaxID=669021 RepID=A0AAN6VWU0_9PEZI|nr:WD40-repeat-containing domain protein [Chaetomidium leptoderma]
MPATSQTSTSKTSTSPHLPLTRPPPFPRIPKAFTKEQAEAVTGNVWTRLGMDPDDKSTWTRHRTNMPSHKTFDAADFAPRAWAAIAELCGGEDRIDPTCRQWRDSLIVNLGSPDKAGKPVPPKDLPEWHVDGDFFVHYLDSPEQGLLVTPLFTDIVPNGGGTFICPEAIPKVAQHLYAHPEGVSTRMTPRGEPGFQEEKDLTWFCNVAKSCTDDNFVEATGEVGDVYLLHPLMLHAVSSNALRKVRIITNPHVALNKPHCFDREDGDYSLVEQLTMRALGKERLSGWKISGPRETVVPARLQIQENMRLEELRRLEAVKAKEGQQISNPLAWYWPPLSVPPRSPKMSDSDSDSDDYRVEEPVLADNDPMRAFMPASFGKTTKEANVTAQIEQSRRQVDQPAPQKQKQKQAASDSDDSDSDDSEESDDEDEAERFPVTHEMVLKTHDRAITSIALDPAGSRMLTGSLDGNVNFHDFASLTPTTLRAFKSVDPWATKKSAPTDSHPIQHVEFSRHSANVFLCVTAHPQAKIMSRDGAVLTEFVKGDMYLRDMNNTKGHVGEIATGTWHPTDQNICVTAGSDSTLRIWDINNKRSQKDVIAFKSKVVGTAGRTRMTAVAWGASSQGNSPVLVSAALDGSLVMYGGNGPFTRPAAEIKDAHRPDTWTGGIDISADGRMVVTRGGDGLIKLWDTRKFKQPLVKIEHPSTSDRYPMTGIKYSPDSRFIITGSASGHLHILNPANLRPEHVTPVTPGIPLIAVDWHPKLNQIITGSANAETHVLYNPSLSSRGALEVMSRAPKKRHVDDDPSFTMDQSQLGLSGDAIITPGALSGGHKRGGGVTASGKSRDPYRPQVQQITPFMRSQPDEKHISENIPLSRMLHEDPREALLKYADVAKKDPRFTSAWSKTQPVTQYAELSDEEGGGGEEGPDKKRVKR